MALALDLVPQVNISGDTPKIDAIPTIAPDYLTPADYARKLVNEPIPQRPTATIAEIAKRRGSNNNSIQREPTYRVGGNFVRAGYGYASDIAPDDRWDGRGLIIDPSERIKAGKLRAIGVEIRKLESRLQDENDPAKKKQITASIKSLDNDRKIVLNPVVPVSSTPLPITPAAVSNFPSGTLDSLQLPADFDLMSPERKREILLNHGLDENRKPLSYPGLETPPEVEINPDEVAGVLTKGNINNASREAYRDPELRVHTMSYIKQSLETIIEAQDREEWVDYWMFSYCDGILKIDNYDGWEAWDEAEFFKYVLKFDSAVNVAKGMRERYLNNLDNPEYNKWPKTRAEQYDLAYRSLVGEWMTVIHPSEGGPAHYTQAFQKAYRTYFPEFAELALDLLGDPRKAIKPKISIEQIDGYDEETWKKFIRNFRFCRRKFVLNGGEDYNFSSHPI